MSAISSLHRWYESQATSPVSPFLILPGVCAKRSQIDSPLPSSFHAPSIWYEAVAVPQKNPLGNVNSEGALNCGLGALFAAPVLAREDPLHPGSVDRPVRAPAPTIDWTNLRRVKRKRMPVPFEESCAGNHWRHADITLGRIF